MRNFARATWRCDNGSDRRATPVARQSGDERNETHGAELFGREAGIVAANAQELLIPPILADRRDQYAAAGQTVGEHGGGTRGARRANDGSETPLPPPP